MPGLDSYTAAWYVAAVSLVLSSGLVAWRYRSPLGVLWAALSPNERRVVMFGFDTNRLKAIAFGVSGLLAGIGGAIYAPLHPPGTCACPIGAKQAGDAWPPLRWPVSRGVGSCRVTITRLG